MMKFTLLRKNKVFYLSFILFLAFLLGIGCKKNSEIQKNTKVENISFSELLQWNSWLQKTLPSPLTLLFSKAEKTFAGNTFFVRVPIQGSSGMLYFAKGNSLEVVFIRRLSMENLEGEAFTGDYEIIDFSTFTQRIFSFKRGKLENAKKIKLLSSRNNSDSKYSTNTTWFGQLLYCLSRYVLSVPGRDQSGDWTICKVLGSDGDNSNSEEEPQNIKLDPGTGIVDWAAFLANVIVPTNGSDPDPLPNVQIPGGSGNYIWVPFTPSSGSGGSNIGVTGSNYEQVQGLYSSTVETIATKVMLSSSQLEWLNSHQEIAKEIETYLLNSSNANYQLVYDNVVNLMTNSSYFQFVSNYAVNNPDNTVWWENDTFLDNPANITFDVEANGGIYSKLTAAEKILVKKYPIEATKMWNNKSAAEEAVINIFGSNSLNDRGDAVRHAFFNAMNQRDCEYFNRQVPDLAKQFSDAHESETPVQFAKEKEMDIFNNTVGQSIGHGKGILYLDDDLLTTVMDKMRNGELRYLSPIWTTDPNFLNTHGITSSTVLTPTN